MTHRNSSPVHAIWIGLSGVLAVGLGCGERPCDAAGSCPPRLVCDFSDNQCKPSCEGDEDCPPDEFCSDTLGFCRVSSNPSGSAEDGGSVEPSDAEVGSDAEGACVGRASCACYANDTCDLGFACRGGVCVDATGELDQPCFPNGTCAEGHECIRLEGGAVCRDRSRGRLGEPCFSWVALGNGLQCRSESAACEEGVCLGGAGDPCGAPAECSPAAPRCIDARCAPASGSDAGAATDSGQG